ncbi:MAG: hypothetical protein JSV65_07960 [Armatimonadota bacterium]|nr:MAG: hypothetical protein JSV65_07960 [Armatimonadota bacterium]
MGHTCVLAAAMMGLMLGVATPRAAARAGDNGIDIYPANPHYWQYHGKPVLLLGGSVEDNLFQIPNLAEHLDTLAAAGGNYVRCTMSARDEGNEWPFRKVGDLYDLDQWDEEYWRRFATSLDETHRRDIIVQIEVWATFDFYRDCWDRNPFNPRNNSTYTAEETALPTKVDSHPLECENSFFWSVPAENNQQTVLKYQQRFVDKLLSYSLRHDHVLYCMDNETAVTPQWGMYWAKHIRDAAAKSGRKVHTTEMWDPWDLRDAKHRATRDHPDIYSFVEISQNNHQRGQTHCNRALWVRRSIADAPRPLNNVKIYGADTGRFGNSRDGVERFWRNIFAGAASARFHRPDSGLGLSELAQRMIRSAREVTGAIDLFRCEPRPDLLADTQDDEAYCLANPAAQYAVYFPDGGIARLSLRGAAGELELRWCDIEAGRWTQPTQLAGKQNVRLRAPGSGQWAALILARER